jgi:hypothetical protein
MNIPIKSGRGWFRSLGKGGLVKELELVLVFPVCLSYELLCSLHITQAVAPSPGCGSTTTSMAICSQTLVTGGKGGRRRQKRVCLCLPRCR